ncbi:MAG: hypothetical protein O7D91_10955 [Planctomycetota bacterium]|nr:hypothetical protein [Planctomycetota bacterium]
MRGTIVIRMIGLTAALLLIPQAAQAQWEVFDDPSVVSVCGVVNVASLEFAVRSCDGALVLVTGPDEGFSNTFVTLDGDVLIDGRASGYIDYQQDADGFFTLWWFSEDGFLIDFDDLISEPYETDALPSEISNVACDASAVWSGDGDCDASFGNMVMQAVDVSSDPTDGDGSLPGTTTTCGLLSLSIFLFTLTGLVLGRQRRVLRGRK